MSTSEPESSLSFPLVWHPFAPRQQRPRASLSDLKESCDRTVQGFWSPLKRGACNSPISCIPLLTRRSDHFSLLDRTSSWPRRASLRREPLLTKVQPGSSSADLHRSRSLFIDLPGEDKPLWLGTKDTRQEAAQAYYQAKSVIDSPQVLPPIIEGPQKVGDPFVKMVARQDAKKTFPLGASHPQRRIHKKTRDWLRPAKKRRLISPEKSRDKVHYTLMEVRDMTKNYIHEIGESGSGTVYYGQLQTGQEVAVKVWAQGFHRASEVFHIWCRLLRKPDKKYFVKVIGYCDEQDQQISIYEYMPGGTLHEHLHKNVLLDPETQALDWTKRLKIALHIAQVLQDVTIPYNLESKNIFLMEDWVPKLHSPHLDWWSLDKESNVYRFGVLLLELISGHQPHKPGDVNVVDSVKKHLLEDYGCIQGTIDPTLGSNSYTESMVKVRNIAHSCMNPECDVRPTMTLVVNEIVHALQLEEGQMGYKGATKTEILQCPSQSKSCSSLGDAWRETKLEIPLAEEPDPWWRQILENTKEKSKQQPKKRFTYCHSSRSWEGDSLSSGSDNEVSSADASASGYGSFAPPLKLHIGSKSKEGDMDLLSEDGENMSFHFSNLANIDKLFAESLSPGPKFCATFTSTEWVPDLATCRRPIMVAGRKTNEGHVELLFEVVGDMVEVVGVGLEWAKVVVTKELGVEVRHIGEHEWKDLWANLKMPGQLYGGFELMNIICLEPQILDQRPSNIVLEDRFGVGLTSTDVVSVYVEDHVEQSNNQGFFPHVLELAKYINLEEKKEVKGRSFSSAEVKRLKRTVGGRHSKEKSGQSKFPSSYPSEDLPLDPPRDPSEALPQDPTQDPPPNPPQDSQAPPPDDPSDPPQDPPPDPPQDPSQDPPDDMEGKKVLVVIIYPELGYLHEGSHGQVVHELHNASIAPILEFEFEVNGKNKKLTTTLRTECNLGEDGGPHLNPPDLGFFQDDITISLTCEIDRAAFLSSARVENVVDVRRTITNIKSSSSTRQCSGQFGVAAPLLNLIGVQGEGSYGGTTEKSDSSAIEISTKQLSSFHVGQKKIPGSLVFNFVYPEEVEGRIADAHHGPRELITLGIGETFESTIIGEWDNIYQDPLDPTCRKCPYSFKIKRHITSIEGLRQSRGIGQEPQCIRQWYKVPLWVNHAMTHILHRHKLTKLEAPGVKRLEHVIEAHPASYSG